jgi:hypothetical protein
VSQLARLLLVLWLCVAGIILGWAVWWIFGSLIGMALPGAPIVHNLHG